MIYARNIEQSLLQRLQAFPVVGITGPRQAGKTTLAKAITKQLGRPSIYLDLELPSDLNKLRNAELFLQENEANLIVLDEVQRMPEL
ncbi:AAA family ATPase, partial [Runella sp.]|uniref:AAA family ATPase n=1 Tax=Runella sp. TaxID=1960881 RepID=UPI00301A2C7C